MVKITNSKSVMRILKAYFTLLIFGAILWLLEVNGSQVAKMKKRVFLTYPCHECRAVGLKSSNYTSKIMIFSNM